MSEKEWDKLFALIEKAINLDGMTATEKENKIKSEAEARDAWGTLNEFCGQLWSGN